MHHRLALGWRDQRFRQTVQSLPTPHEHASYSFSEYCSRLPPHSGNYKVHKGMMQMFFLFVRLE